MTNITKPKLPQEEVDRMSRELTKLLEQDANFVASIVDGNARVSKRGWGEIAEDSAKRMADFKDRVILLRKGKVAEA